MKKTVCICCLLLLLGALAPFAAAQSWTPNGPLPRFLHTAVFDPSTKQMIIYGGFSPTSNTMQGYDADVWRLLPSASLAGPQNWAALRPTGTPPAPRGAHLAGYDPGSNRMVLFGGITANECVNDTWVITNANGIGGQSAWLQLSPIGGPPGVRSYMGGAYDPMSNTLLVYGGLDCFTITYRDFWVLSHANGLGGTPTWKQLFPTGGPGPLDAFTMVYDPNTNELILFSGGSNGVFNNNVWILTNANGTGGTPAWNQLFPIGGPPASRFGSSATYDPASNRMTIFGGQGSAGTFLGDVWVLTNANGTGGTPAWTQIAQSSTVYPAPRYGHTAAYDASRNVMIVFGGEIYSNYPIDLATNDVFFLSDANGQ